MRCPVCNKPRIWYQQGERSNGAPFIMFRCMNAQHFKGFVNGPPDPTYPLTLGIWRLILENWPLDENFNPEVLCPHPDCGGELIGTQRNWYNLRKGNALFGWYVRCSKNKGHFHFFINKPGWRPPR